MRLRTREVTDAAAPVVDGLKQGGGECDKAGQATGLREWAERATRAITRCQRAVQGESLEASVGLVECVGLVHKGALAAAVEEIERRCTDGYQRGSDEERLADLYERLLDREENEFAESKLATVKELENLAEVARLLGKSNQKETMPRILSSIEAHSRHTCYLKSKSHEHAVRKLGATSILRVSLYHPVQTSTKIQEFLVLGSQKLSELKDKIYCITDTIAKHRNAYSHASLFLIENDTYVDFRQISYAAGLDYAHAVTRAGNRSDLSNNEVGAANGEQGGGAAVRKMEDTTFSELCLHFGPNRGYAYYHQNCCRHEMIFEHIRLPHHSDVRDRYSYPVLTYFYKPKVRLCTICEKERATWVAKNDPNVPVSPCYFCDSCQNTLYCKADSSRNPNLIIGPYWHD